MVEISDGVAVGFGVFVTVLLAFTMCVAGLKAGITPGASTLVVLSAWAVFSKQVKGPAGRRFLNLAQVAGSSGMAVVSGVIFTAPLLQVLHLSRAQEAIKLAWNATTDGAVPILTKLNWPEKGRGLVDEYYKNPDGSLAFPHVNTDAIPFMMLFCVAGALIGYGFVGISTKKFLSDPTLPAPEAHACSTMVTASAASEADQPAMKPSLVASSVTSFVLPTLTTMGIFPNYLTIFASEPVAGRTWAIQMPCSPVYIGIGGLLTLSTAIVTVSGAFTRLIGDAAVAPLGETEWGETFPDTTMRWIGGGAMTVGVVFSLVKFMLPRQAAEGENGDESLLDIPQKTMVALYGAVAAGVLVLALGIVVIDSDDLAYAAVMIVTIFTMASLMVTLGAILSLQIGSSASPVSGTVFVTTLVCCLVSLGYRNATAPSDIDPAEKERLALDAVEGISYMLITACVAVSAANDASQDYKTLQLGGIPPRDGFFGQILGLLAGAMAVPISFYIAHNAYGLGTDELPAPQGQLFAIIIEGILIDEKIPWIPVIIGLLIGCAAVAIEVYAARAGKQLPAMGFAVGLYLPPQLGLGILFGAGCRFVGEKMYEQANGKAERTYESILAAAGMITGAAFLDLIVGVLVICGVNTTSMNLAVFGYEDGKPLPIPTWFTWAIGLPGLALLGGILLYNARFGIPEASESTVLQSQLSTAKSFDGPERVPLAQTEGTEMKS